MAAWQPSREHRKCETRLRPASSTARAFQAKESREAWELRSHCCATSRARLEHSEVHRRLPGRSYQDHRRTEGMRGRSRSQFQSQASAVSISCLHLRRLYPECAQRRAQTDEYSGDLQGRQWLMATLAVVIQAVASGPS